MGFGSFYLNFIVSLFGRREYDTTEKIELLVPPPTKRLVCSCVAIIALK